MSDPAVLARNLAAIAATDPALAEILRRTAGAGVADVVASRSGLPVPRVVVAGRPVPLHSTFDPMREAERIASSSSGGYVVCLGLGAGYALAPLLRRPDTERVLVVEHGIAMLRSLLEVSDLSGPLADPRVRLAAPEEPESIGQLLLSDFLPAVYQSLCATTLRARVDADPDFYAAASRSVNDALLDASRDYTVQSRFGLRWLRNTVANLRTIRGREGAAPPPLRLGPHTGRVLVTGAGPSLEIHIPRIVELRESSLVIATDASLAPLMHAGISPDVVLSVDCQHVCYRHFLSGLPRSSAVVLDIASPPVLGRLPAQIIFAATQHPLARYLARRGLDLPSLDVTGGNVAHAAVSLAALLGAQEVRLFGVDLSYPEGKPYARGCFLYPSLDERASRLGPLENAVAGVGLLSPSARRVRTPEGFAVVPGPMEGYREHLGRLAARAALRIYQEPGLGPALDLPAPRAVRRAPGPPPLRPVPHGLVGAILRAYGDGLRGLPEPAGPFPAYLAALDAAQREILATLLPLIANRRLALGGFREAFSDAKLAALLAVDQAGPDGDSAY